MRHFVALWFGQLISILGSSMTRFALILWIYKETNNVTATALLGFFSMFPFALISPFAGMIVDKFNRKVVMFFSDFGAAIGTLALLFLIQFSELNLSIIYGVMVISGICEAFQSPAMNASITLMMPKKHYARANAMRSFAVNASRMVAPIIAGALISFIGLRGIIFIDLITFLIGIVTLALVRIPEPERLEDHKIDKISVVSMVKSYKTGFGFIRQIPQLSTLMFIFFFINLVTGMTYYGIFPAYILSRSDNNSIVLGTVETFLGLGGVFGSIIIGFLKMPKNKIKLMFFFTIISYVVGDFLVAVGNNLHIWCFAVFSTSVFIAFIITYENVIWQMKVRPDLQGRVFAFRSMFYTIAMPIGYLIGGVLADKIFEPAMENSVFPQWVISLVGQSQGSGMAVMFLLSSVIGVSLGIYGFLNKKLKVLD